MKKKITALKAWVDKHVSAAVRTDVSHVVLTFAVTFVATAAPLLPTIVNSGSYPSLSVLHAVFAAGAAAGLKASIPLARTLIVAAAVKVATRESAKKEVARAALVASVLAQIEAGKNNTAQVAPAAPVNPIPGPDIP